MIAQGLALIMTGMIVVFIFLSLIVLIVNLSAGFFEKYSKCFPEETVQNSSPQSTELEIVAAITAAYLKR